MKKIELGEKIEVGWNYYLNRAGNCISTSMSIALDLLTPKSIRNIFLPFVVYMCDMVTLGGKGSGNRIYTSVCLTFEPQNR
jgi:hypothetical protein